MITPSKVALHCRFCATNHTLHLDHAEQAATDWPIGLLASRKPGEYTRYAYWYRCPTTGKHDVRNCPPEMAISLMLRCIPVRDWERPTLSARPPAAAPITADELLDFHELLAATDLLVELVA